LNNNQMSAHPGSSDASRKQYAELSCSLSSKTSDSTAQRCDLRLVIVTHFYPNHGGGIEVVAGELVEEFARRGVQVCWFSSNTDDPPSATGEGVNYVPIGTSNVIERLTQLSYPLWSPLALPQLWRAIGAANVVHIHEHLYPGSIVALVVARLRRRPVVITQHMGTLGLQNPVLTALYEWGARLLGRLLFPLAARRVFISANVCRFFGREADPHSTLIFNGIDSARFSAGTAEQRQRLREALEIAPGHKVALFVGRFVRKKGLHILERLTQRFPSVLWIIVGSGPEDPASWDRTNVRIPGRLDHSQLPDYYRAADLLLLPSSGEGFPLVVQEALCCGTGVLSTEEVVSACPPASKMMRACPTPRNDVDLEVWEKALADLLSDDAYINSRETRSQEARSLWSWELCANQYLDLFSNLAWPGSKVQGR
jgi:glycosyltransferase involved in cell wall biosynthesis